MAKVKVTVTIPEEELALAKEAVQRGAAPSLSAYVTEALIGHRPGPSLRELVAELRAEIGPPTEEVEAWARTALGLD